MGLSDLIDEYSSKDEETEKEETKHQEEKACPKCGRVCEHVEGGKYLCHYKDCGGSKFEEGWSESETKGFLEDVDMVKVAKDQPKITKRKIS